MRRERYFHLVFVMAASVLSIECAAPRTPPSPEPAVVIPAIEPEETAIRAVLNDVERAMEQRDMYKVLTHVSADYRDKVGRDYTDIRMFLQRIFANYDSLEIARSDTKVTIDQDAASVTESFVTFARGKAGSGVANFTVKGRTFVFLQKSGDRWLIAEWGEGL